MTVSSTTSRNDYVGDGILDVYPYEFKIFVKTDLKVYVDEELMEVDTHYTVTDVGEDEGGNIVFKTAYIPALDEKIAIIRDLPLTQLADYEEADKFPAETHEAVADRLIMIAQRMYEQVKKTFKIPIYSDIEEIEVPIQASSFLKWNEDADAIVCVPEWEAGDPLPEHADSHENGGSDEMSLEDLSGMPADLATHASRHKLGGADAIKLDDLAAPDNNTDLNVSITKHGLCPIAPNNTAQVLRGDGAFGWSKVVQIVNALVVTSTTGTTAIPYDDTIPQNDEGDEYMTLAITPKADANKLKIDVVIHLANGAAGTLCAALFQDDTAGALACGYHYIGNVDNIIEISFTYYMTAGTTSETTFKIRAGAGSGTTTFNGGATARKYGGVLTSSITITEIAA